MEFGLLKSNRRYVSEKIEIRPLWDIDKTVNWLLNEAEISDGWIYPPLVQAKKTNREKGSKSFEAFAEYHVLPCTHSIIFHPFDNEKAKFLILGLGFFFGVYLSPAGYYNLGRVAYQEGKLTGVIPVGTDIELALISLARFYDENPNKRKSMFAVIHWFLVGQSYAYPWDRFEAHYKVLDGIFRISDLPRCKHAERANRLVEKHNIQLPTWAELKNNRSVLSQVRNDLAHEAIYAGQPIGYAHPDENFDVDFSNFNTKLIAATLGIKSSYLYTSPHDRQYHAWHIV